MAAEYQNAEDAAAFRGLLDRDPESRKCFECNYPNAPWCDINHGILICLDCSGVHRGLGVHLSFVRSSSMDGWSNWRPEKLQQMMLGGNARARKFFESKGVPKAPIRARYEHVGALMYKDMLEAEVAGRPFNEAAWRPPEWALPKPQGVQQQVRSTGGANADRFRGTGSSGAQRSGGSAGGGDDWLGALSSGLTAVASQATQLASTAATATVQGSQQLAAKIQDTTRAAPAIHTDDIAKKAAEAATATTAAVSSAWGMLSSWTASTVSTIAAATTQHASRGEDDDDDLGAVARKLRAQQASGEQPAVDGSRFRGVEHRAEARSDGLASLASALPRGSQYEGIGGDSPTAPPAAGRPAPRVAARPAAGSPTGGLGSRQNSSQPTAPPSQQQASSPTVSTAVPAAKTAVPADWGWDEE